MPRKVFYSFHYKPDSSRASQIRNIGVVEGNTPARDNEWESITGSGDPSIKRWIDEQLNGRSCTIVLIGQNTAGRKWINYEIEKSWNDGKGLLGIYIHNLKDLAQAQSSKGANPFDNFRMERGKVEHMSILETFLMGPGSFMPIFNEHLSSIVRAYDPPSTDSRTIYQFISQHLVGWIEDAIRIRQNY